MVLSLEESTEAGTELYISEVLTAAGIAGFVTLEEESVDDVTGLVA